MIEILILISFTIAIICMALGLCDNDRLYRLEKTLRKFRGEYLPQRVVDRVLK